ncbi:MAG: hypothetical protein ACK4WK_11495, partial [Anaerolineae bacterium]
MLPPGTDAETRAAVAVVAARRGWTVGGSADDAGIGDLDVRRVIAINPSGWNGDLRQFFERYYPGVEYREVRGEKPINIALALVGGNSNLPLSLSQRDGRWASHRLGEEAVTIGQAGCFLVALTAALRHQGYDLLPDELNLLLLLERLPFIGANLSIAEVGRSLGNRALREDTISLERLRALLGDGWEVIAANPRASHFMYVRGVGDRTVRVIDPWDGEERDVDIASLGGIRALKFGEELVGAIPEIPTGTPITLHFQTLEDGWREWISVRPRSVKVFSVDDIRALRAAGYTGIIVWRPYFNDYDQAAILAAPVDQAVERFVGRVLGELADAPREHLF